jgi:hypothetical protein
MAREKLVVGQTQVSVRTSADQKSIGLGKTEDAALVGSGKDAQVDLHKSKSKVPSANQTLDFGPGTFGLL